MVSFNIICFVSWVLCFQTVAMYIVLSHVTPSGPLRLCIMLSMYIVIHVDSTADTMFGWFESMVYEETSSAWRCGVIVLSLCSSQKRAWATARGNGGKNGGGKVARDLNRGENLLNCLGQSLSNLADRRTWSASALAWLAHDSRLWITARLRDTECKRHRERKR